MEDRSSRVAKQQILSEEETFWASNFLDNFAESSSATKKLSFLHKFMTQINKQFSWQRKKPFPATGGVSSPKSFPWLNINIVWFNSFAWIKINYPNCWRYERKTRKKVVLCFTVVWPFRCCFSGENKRWKKYANGKGKYTKILIKQILWSDFSPIVLFFVASAWKLSKQLFCMLSPSRWENWKRKASVDDDRNEEEPVADLKLLFFAKAFLLCKAEIFFVERN